MKNFWLYIILLVIPLIFSCQKKEYHYVPKNQLFKFKESDTLKYLSNLGKNDKFFIRGIIKRFDDVDEHSYYEYYVTFIYHIINNTIDSTKIYHFYKYIDSGSLEWLDGSLGGTSSNMTSYQLGEFKLDNVYITERTDIDTINRNVVRAIYYQDNYGVIRYDYKSGEYFELQNLPK